MTYNDYLIKITETIKIRSTNYRLSQNDIIYLTNNVYAELMRELNFAPTKQAVALDQTEEEYALDTLYTTVGAEILFDAYKIEDKYGTEIGKYFTDLGNNTFQVKEELATYFYNEYDLEIIYFLRHTMPDIEALDDRQQILMFDVIINGIMHYIEDALPNPTASDTPNANTKNTYAVFMKSIESLRNRFPQVS